MTPSTNLNLSEMFSKMSTPALAVVVALLLMAVYLITICIERGIFFSKNKKRSRTFALALRDLFSKHGARSLTMMNEMPEKTMQSTLAQVVVAASEAFGKKSSDIEALDVVVGINRAVERTIERQTNRMKRGFGGLATIASTAPFVGLFGTVIGIINAFLSIQKTGGEGGMGAVSGGIAEALVTTAFGLLVAIPAVAAYNYFTGVVDRMVVDMDEVASEMVEAVVLNKK